MTSTELPTLVGVREIADRLHVPRTTVSMWIMRRSQSGFPRAVEELHMGPVFVWSEVESWFHSRYETRKEITS